MLCLPTREEEIVTVDKKGLIIERTSTCGNWNILKMALICREAELAA